MNAFRGTALVSIFLAGCRCGAARGVPPRVEAPPVDAAVPAPQGIVVERMPLDVPPAFPFADPTLTLVRIDPKRYLPRLLTAEEHGGARTVGTWAKDFGLWAVINASMYDEDGKSVSFMVDGDRAYNGRDDARFGGLLAFGAAPPAPPIQLVGKQCPHTDTAQLRKTYRTLIANYRLLDCDGSAIPWKDEKAYSAAAIGIDHDGWVVLAHCRAPYRMETFARILAAPATRIASAVYLEGGPEASLWLEAGPLRVREVGNYGTKAHENRGEAAFWDLPNVIGFAPRDRDKTAP